MRDRPEAAADPTVTDHPEPRRVTVREAVEMFLNDDKARGWNRSPKEIEDVVQAAIPALMRGAEAESR
jgi:hypothetical protein